MNSVEFYDDDEEDDEKEDKPHDCIDCDCKKGKEDKGFYGHMNVSRSA